MKMKGKVAIASKKDFDLLKLLQLGFLFIVTGCSYISELNQNKSNIIQESSCMDNFYINKLDESLLKCENVIRNFPNSPKPLIDRSLIHRLSGNSKLACIDIQKAIKIIEENSLSITDIVNYEIRVRHEACKQADSIFIMD